MMSRAMGLVTVVAFCVILACGAGTAEAGKGKKKKKGDTAAIFKKLDTNNDGKVSRDEFAKIKEVVTKLADKKDKKIDKLFTKLDANSDNYLSADEFANFGKKK